MYFKIHPLCYSPVDMHNLYSWVIWAILVSIFLSEVEAIWTFWVGFDYTEVSSLYLKQKKCKLEATGFQLMTT